MKAEYLKIEKMMKRDAKKGFKMIISLVENSNKMTVKEKKELNKWLRRMQYVYRDLFVEMYTKNTYLSEKSLKMLADGSSAIFKQGGMGVTPLAALKSVMRLIDEGNIDDAVKTVKRAARTVHYRAETLINTLRIGKARSGTFDGASDDDVFEYYGPKLNPRKKCKIWLKERYFKYSEIKKLDNGQKLPVEDFCGGYNCRHRWVRVVDPDKLEIIRRRYYGA